MNINETFLKQEFDSLPLQVPSSLLRIFGLVFTYHREDSTAWNVLHFMFFQPILRLNDNTHALQLLLHAVPPCACGAVLAISASDHETFFQGCHALPPFTVLQWVISGLSFHPSYFLLPFLLSATSTSCSPFQRREWARNMKCWCRRETKGSSFSPSVRCSVMIMFRSASKEN